VSLWFLLHSVGSQKPRPNHISDLVSLALLTLMVLWFGHEMLTQGKVPFFRDLGPYFYPMRLSLAESLRTGELPLWDRHMAAGFPLLADFQSGAFYLPHLAFLVLPFFSAVSTIFLFHYLVAATGSYLLWRHWGYPAYLSMLGAILFTFGGVIVSLTNLLNHFQAAVWLPWLVLLAERCFRSCSWRDFLGFVAVSLLPFLNGSPEFYIMSMTFVTLALLRLKATSPESGPYRRIALVILGGNALVVALAMVQLAPTIELFLHSRRSQPIPYSEAVDWSLSPSNIFNLFFLDKEVDRTLFPGMRLFFLSRASFFVSYYLGAISLFGAWFWALYSSAKERAITFPLLVITLVLALGGYTPFYAFILHYFPLLSLVRFPEKFFFLTYSILCFIVVKGLFVFCETEIPKRRGAVVALFTIPLVLLLFYLFLRFNTGLLSQFIASTVKEFPVQYSPTFTVAASVVVSVERQLFLSLAFLILLFAAKKRLARVALLQILLITVVFIDLDRAHRDYQYLLNPSLVYGGTKVISQPGPNFGRVFYYPPGETLHPAEYSVLARPSFREAISLVYGNLLPNSGVFYGFDYFQEIDAFARWPYLKFLNFADPLDQEKRLRLLGTLNVKYVISFRELPGDGITLARYFPEYPSWLYEIQRTVPRVYVVNKSVVETNATQILRRLASLDFDPNQAVVLDEDLANRPARPLLATAKIVRYENQAVTIDVSLNDSGILVLADSHYPGWKAYVDGKEEIIRRANLFFRAVSLPAGNHKVEFRYEPWSFKVGLTISLVTLFFLVVISMIIYFRGSKYPHGERSSHRMDRSRSFPSL
jgi:Bacterial membrane protein YfhO